MGHQIETPGHQLATHRRDLDHRAHTRAIGRPRSPTRAATTSWSCPGAGESDEVEGL